MPEAHETLAHAIKVRNECDERLRELQRAARALGRDNEYAASLTCVVSVRQGTAWDLDLPAPKEFVKTLIDAAMIQERDTLANYDRRLTAARDAMQRD